MKAAGIRKAAWFWITAAVTGLALLAIVFMPEVSDPKKRIERRVAELGKEARFRKTPRTVLTGTEIPGNAWEEYALALQEDQNWPENRSILLEFAEGAKVDRWEVEALIAAHHGALDHLRDGALRTNGQYPYRWEKGPDMEAPEIWNLTIVGLVTAEASVLRENGRTEEATRLLLALTVFGHDFVANGPESSDWAGTRVYLAALDGIRDLVLSGKLTRVDLADLAGKLEIVERDYPDAGVTLANEVWLLGMRILDEPRKAGSSFKQRWNLFQESGLREALSPGWTVVDTFEALDDLARLRVDGMDFGHVARVAAAIDSESFSTADRQTLTEADYRFTTSAAVIVKSHRDVLARLRVLQAAARYAADGRIPTLADPFGANLLAKEEAGIITIWSVGPNGVNRDGRAKWTYPSQAIAVELPKYAPRN